MAREPESGHDAWVGRYLTVRVERWPGMGEYELIRKHQAVAVVPITPDDDVLLDTGGGLKKAAWFFEGSS